MSSSARRLFQLHRLFSRIEVSPSEAMHYRVAPRPPSEIPPEALKRLGYLYSCSGNVNFWSGGKQFAITLNSVHRWLPSELWEAFGGGMAIRPGMGGNRPAFIWRLCGAKAAEVGEILAPYAGRKKELLQLLGEALVIRKDSERRKEILDRLREMKRASKRCFFSIAQVQSWSDFAELLDARGSVRIVPGTGSIRIIINHPNRNLLLSISPFLEKQRVPNVIFPSIYRSIYAEKEYVLYSWDLQGKVLPPFILRKALEHGMLLQRPRVEKVLESFGGKGVRMHLPPRNNQNRHKTLTSGELELSRLLGTLRDRKKRRRSSGAGGNLSESLEAVWYAREVSKKRTEMSRLRKEIRALLKV